MRTPRRRRLLYGLLVTLALLGAAELAARLLVSDQPFVLNPVHNCYRHDPLLFWSMPPDRTFNTDGNRIQTNALGLRDDPVQRPRPPGQVRILSLGESTTWGHMVPLAQTYGERLEAMLNRGAPAGRSYSVINAGVGGYSIFQSYLYLAHRGVDLDPDLVLVYHEFNDYLPAGTWDRNNPMLEVTLTDHQRHQRRRPFLWVLTGLYQSRLYMWARNTLLVRRFRQQPPHTQGPPKARPALPRVPRQDRLFALEQMRALCAARGIRLALIHPLYQNDVDSCQGRCLLRAFAQDHNVPLLDLHRRLSCQARADPGFFMDECHPTARGHEVMAQELHRQLTQGKLLEPRSRAKR